MSLGQMKLQSVRVVDVTFVTVEVMPVAVYNMGHEIFSLHSSISPGCCLQEKCLEAKRLLLFQDMNNTDLQPAEKLAHGE